MTTKIVERYKIFKNSNIQQDIFSQEQVGNAFQLQELNLQNVKAKASIEDDLALEDIEELDPDQSNPKAELSEARNEPIVQSEPQDCQKQETANDKLTVEAEIHPDISGDRNIEVKITLKKVQHLHEDNLEDLDGIETLSEEIIDVQDSFAEEPNLETQKESHDGIVPKRSLPTPMKGP